LTRTAAKTAITAVVTGGPGTGKSTLLAVLAQRGVAVEAEVARAILQAPGGMALRAADPAAFADAMFAGEAARQSAAHARGGTTVFDRGVPDTVGFLTLEQLPVPTAIDQHCRSVRYSGPIFVTPSWPAIYAQDAERTQTWEEAVASARATSAAWQAYGYSLVEIPCCDVAARADFVLAHLSRV
jgi:predicted ATPase